MFLVQAYLEWTHDNTSAEAYDCLRVIRAYLKGDGLFSPGDLWTRHLLARCFILEAREPEAGKKQIELRKDALRYCEELKGELSKATDSQVSLEDIEQMEELIKLEQDQFDPEPHEGKFHKLKAKFFGHV